VFGPDDEFEFDGDEVLIVRVGPTEEWKRYVWYREEAFGPWPSEEADRYNALPRARLAPLVFAAMETPSHPFQLYSTWEQAVKDLSKGLARMRALLQEPRAKKARE
jgi:hypothetical protein